MAIVSLGSNIQSLRAQRQLGNASSTMSKTLEALSSGLRINRAGDDAAGLAIASGLKTDERVFTQGVRNLNDGISLLNIADGALGELTGVVIRIQELAEQAANGTLGVAQRKALDTEAQALSKEYLRIAQSTDFNGRKLFSGGFGQLTLQGGYGQSGGITSGLGGAIGDGTFQAKQDLITGNSPGAVAMADLDGDGKLDLATTIPNSVGVLLGNGDGSFRTEQDYGVGTNPLSVAVGDLNSDGTPDLLVSNGGGANTVSVLLGNGDGTFKPKQDFAAGTSPLSLDVGDFNVDGKQDVVVLNFAANTVSVLLGNGDGTLQPRQALATGAGSFCVAVGDFNGDGKPDLVAANATPDTLSIIIGNGDGTFQAKQDIATGQDPAKVAVGDFNGDGKQDLVATANGIGAVSIHLGNGDGTFQAKQDYGAGLFPSTTGIGDFNGDGNQDLVVTNNGAATISVLIGNGNGTFQAKQDYATGTNPSLLAIGDYSGDGVQDLVIQRPGNPLTLFTAITRDGVPALLPFSLRTSYQARQAIPQMALARSRISAQRGVIGAFQSRLETGLSSLQSATENSAVAGSRITDADIAVESATLVRSRILQQASAAILAQANQQPAIALQLLRA